jgi:hypothetical protein
MSMFHAEYWKNWGSFGNQTNKAIENQPSGDSAKNLVGNKYDQQTGSSVAVQVGNKSSKQTGWSNSLLEGFSFSTTLGQSTSTTVGASFSNHVGFKWGMFVGPETSINAATSVKVAKGAAYSFDTVTKCETTAQKAESSLKKTEIATALTRTIGQAIDTFALGVTQTVGGNYNLLCVDHSVTATTSVTNGATVYINAVDNLALQGNRVGINAVSQLKVFAAGRVVVDAGGILNLG